jgi:hypothetical protein
MTSNLSSQWELSNPENLAKGFHRLGWIGFWIQATLLSFDLVLLIYVHFFTGAENLLNKGIDLTNYLSYSGLSVLCFTTYWFFRYTRLAKQILNPALRPSQATVEKTLWIGLWAGCLGVLFSLLLMGNAVMRLLFVFLFQPQTGIQLAPAPGSPANMMLSAIDAVTLMSLMIAMTAELIVLGFTLWLLFKVSRQSNETAAASANGNALNA